MQTARVRLSLYQEPLAITNDVPVKSTDAQDIASQNIPLRLNHLERHIPEFWPNTIVTLLP